MKLVAFVLAAAAGLAVTGVVWVMGSRADMLQMHNISFEAYGRLVEMSRERPPLSEALMDAARKAGVEPALIDAVAGARAKAEAIKVDERLIDDLENFKRYDHYQADWAAAQLRLLAACDVAGLKVIKEYRRLKEDVEGLETRVDSARHDYNALVLQLNNSIEGFPGASIAQRENLKPRPYLTESAPPPTQKKK